MAFPPGHSRDRGGRPGTQEAKGGTQGHHDGLTFVACSIRDSVPAVIVDKRRPWSVPQAENSGKHRGRGEALRLAMYR